MRNGQRSVGMLLALAVLTVACTGPGSAIPSGISEGHRARDFTLKALDGAEVSLGDYVGDVVLINFWATWCAPCRAELPGFEAAHRAHRDQGFVVLGINVQESHEVVQSFVDEMGVTYPVLLDEKGEVMKEYRILGLPASLLVDREGVIAVRHLGYLPEDKLGEYLGKSLPGPGGGLD